MASPDHLPRLHVLAGGPSPEATLSAVDAALAGGAPCIQLRAKDLSDRALYTTAVEVTQRCHELGAWCIVNDRVDIALASGADGVHLGAQDLPVAAARRLAGDELLVGGTARDAATASELVAAGASYLGVGPVYGTSTKDGLPEPFGPQGLAPVAGAVGVPVIAISGITASRVPEVVAAGAHGVAVASAITGADDPAAAIRALLEQLPEASSAEA